MLRERPTFSSICILLVALTLPLGSVHAQFVDVAGSVGISTPHDGQPVSVDMGLGTGAAWFDYDMDGDLDVYISMRTGANLLYQNNGGTFTEVAAAAGAQDASHDGSGVVAADFNNDGCKDLYLANSNEDVLLQNNCDGTFTDVTSGSGLEASGARRGTSASVGDYDNDGLLDIYLAHHTPVGGYGVPDDKTKDQDYLFHNDGNFQFTDVSNDMLGSSEREDASFIGAWTDFDNDGDLDIYLIRDCGFDGSGAMSLWRNDGGTNGVSNWTFTEVVSSVNGNWCQNGMGVAVGDYDRNGYIDLFYTDNGSAPGGTDPNRAGTILLANSATGYTDMTDVAGVSSLNFSWGANFFDYNLDGYLDLFMAGGALNDPSNLTESQLWESNGSSFTFSNVSAAQGVNDTGRSRTGVYGDYDGDGDPDLLLVNYAGDIRLFRNDNGGGNNYLIVDLQGVTSNRDGIGARIEITSAGGTQVHEVRSGSSLGGGDDTGAYFGLGTDSQVTSLTVTWPSGTSQTLSSVGVNQRMLIVENDDTPVGGGLFTDVSSSAGVNVTHSGSTSGDMGIGSGAAWFDYDNDGDQDLYMTNRESANHLFRNDGGVFTDVAAAAGVADASGDGSGVAVADYNNDGCIDMYLANSFGDAFYENNCDGTFTNIYSGSGLESSEERRGTSASWGDYDADGFVDLYVANHMPVEGATFNGDSEQDYLYRNNGDGTFTDVSDMLLGTDRIGRSFIAGWNDYDNDGDADLLTIRDCPFGQNSGPMRLYRNDGGTNATSDWTFTQVAESVNLDWCQNGMGLATGDYNRDGWLDFFFTDNGANTDVFPNARVGAVLFRNDNGTFTETTDAANVDNNKFSWGANFFDYDNDMWQDLYMVAGAMAPENLVESTLYSNDGDGTFTDVSANSGGLNDPANTRTSAYADYDGDGDLDMFIVNYGQDARLFRNDNGNGNNWVIIDLEGVTSNRNGIGARIELTTPDGVTQHFEVRSGSSLGAGDDLAAHFGLGSNASISNVTVKWPSGIEQVVGAIGINQRTTIVESGVAGSSLSVSPLSVDFGQVEEGFSSAPTTMTMTNSGPDAIDVTSVSVTGTDAGDFSHTFAGPVTISGGSTSTFDVTFAPSAQAEPEILLPEGVLYRVNAGGALTDDWEEDTDASPSTYLLAGSASIETDTPTPSLDASVPAGTPVDLFTSMRRDADKADPAMEWDFPVTSGEQIEVRLFFVEMSRCSDANRLFDVEIEGAIVLDNFDVYLEAGSACNVGIMRSFTVTPLDGNLDIDFLLENGRPSIVAAIEILGEGSGSTSSPRAAQLIIDHTGVNASLNVELMGEALVDDGGNNAPSAAFTTDVTDFTVDFTDASSDSDGTIVSWSWDFGDGNTSTVQNPSHTYAGFGTYTAGLTVTDDQGATGFTSQTITIADPTADGAFIEEGGQIVMEAENYAAVTQVNNHIWTFTTAQAGHSGAGAMTPDPNDGTASNKTNSTEMTYDVELTTTGTYYVWVRVFAATVNDNSLHMGHNGDASAKKIDSPDNMGSWNWTNIDTKGNRVSMTFSTAGANTINAWMREDGLILDKIVLTTDEAFVPTGEGPAESPRATANPSVAAKAGFDAENKMALQTNDTSVPTEFELGNNYPNPFNPTTTIQFGVPQETHVTLEVYDSMGRRVATLINGQYTAGRYETSWNGRSDTGSSVASGVYLYRLTAGTHVEAKTMLLMK